MKILLTILPLIIGLFSCKNNFNLLYKEKDKTKMDLIKEAIQKEDIAFLDTLSIKEIDEYFGETSSQNELAKLIGNNKQDLTKIIEAMNQTLNTFHRSLVFGSKKVIRFLLNKGANPNILTKDNKNWMDLFFTDRKNQNKDEKNEDRFEIINYMLEKNASTISHLKEKGRNFLYYLGCQEKFTKKQYESIISHIKEEIDFNMLSYDVGSTVTPLLAAVVTSNINYINILLKNGGTRCNFTLEELKKTDKTELGKKLTTIPIINSIVMGNLSSFELLFDNKINIEFLEGKILNKVLLTFIKSKFGTEENRLKILKRILKIKKPSTEILSEMFLKALTNGKKEIAHYLLATFKDINVNINSEQEEVLIKNQGSLKVNRRKKISALCYAIRICDLEMVKELIKRGAKIEDQKNDFLSPLMFIFKGSSKIMEEDIVHNLSLYNEDKALEIIKILEKNGINLNKKLSQNLNLLEIAIKTDCQKIAKYLLERDIELPKTYNLRGSSAYTDTIFYEQDELFIELFEKFKSKDLKSKSNNFGAFKINIIDNIEIHFLNLATQTSNDKIAEYLIIKGANPFEQNKDEFTLFFGTPISEIDNSTSFKDYRRSLKIEKNLNSLDLAIKNTNVKIFDLILLKSNQKDLEKNREKIIHFIRNNLLFGSKTFIHNVKEGFFGVLKFILINIENEFKDLQSYVNYAKDNETALDILFSFFKEEKEIIELFKKNSAFKFNEIQQMEKEKKRKESLVYLILNQNFEGAFKKIDKEPNSIYEADENNTTPLMASIKIISNNLENENFEKSYELFKKIIEAIEGKEEINRIDINKKSALSYIIESKHINLDILESIIDKGANINFRYGKKYHFIINLIEFSENWEKKEDLINIFRKSKEKIFLTKKDLEKISKIYCSSENREPLLKMLKGIVQEEDLTIKEQPLKTKKENEKIKISEVRETFKFKRNFERTSLENRKAIKDEINDLINGVKIDIKLLQGLDTKVWEIRKDRIRIFYFVDNETLFLIDLEDNKHQDTLPSAYYQSLATIKKQIVSDIKFGKKEKYGKFE